MVAAETGRSRFETACEYCFLVKKGNDTITLFTTDDQGCFRISFGRRSLHHFQGGIAKVSSGAMALRGGCDCGSDQTGSVELRHCHAMSMISRDAQQATDNPMASQATDRENRPPSNALVPAL